MMISSEMYIISVNYLDSVHHRSGHFNGGDDKDDHDSQWSDKRNVNM